MKREDYKKMVWEKARQMGNPFEKGSLKGRRITPSITSVNTNVIQKENEDWKEILVNMKKNNEKLLEGFVKDKNMSKKKTGYSKGRKIISFRAGYKILLLLKELKNIIGGSVSSIVRMAVIHLYADMKKGLNIWQ